MKRRIVRVSWLAAWSFWLWLGFGLHRELPRDVGPPVCQIPVKPYQARSTYVAGFDGPSRIVVAELPAAGPKTVSVYDAETGDLLASYPSPKLERRSSWFDSKLNHGHFIVNERERGGLKALNLSNGDCQTINPSGVLGFGVHPTKPLVAFIYVPTNPSQRRLSVHNLLERRLAFECDLPTEGRQVDTPSFIAGTEKILMIQTQLTTSDPLAGTPILVCTMTPPGTKSTVEVLDVGPPDRGWATASLTGRAAFGSAEHGAFEVFDFNLGRIIFSRPETPKGSPWAPIGATQNPPDISPDGRLVLGDWPQTLWDIDAGVALWKARSFDFAFPNSTRAAPGSVSPRFLILEGWGEFWKHWLPNLRYTTYACRDMKDGRLIYRLRPMSNGSGYYSPDWSLVLGDNGFVYRLPPPVSWPLLALCQSILALPLVLLWAVLRFRSRRAARRRPAVESAN